MAQPLDAVPNGTNVFIDANVLVYGLTGTSAQCKTFLERCSREEVTGITLFEIVNNATHSFMKAEAVQKALCAQKGALAYLKGHPDQVRLLTDYWTNTRRLLALNLLFVPLELDLIEGAHPERCAAGLLTDDSTIVAAMRAYGISSLATRDNQLDTVARIDVFSPTDVP